MSLLDRVQRTESRSGGPDLVGRYRERLLEEIDPGELAGLSTTQRRARLERVLSHLIAAEGPVLVARERAALIRRVVVESHVLGVLESLLADEFIHKILVY